MRRPNWIQITLVLVCVLLFAVTAQAADNWLGTWKLNLAKSKYSPGPAPKSQTIKYEAQPGGFKSTVEIVDTQGKTIPSGYTVKFDGKEVPWTGNPNADTMTLKRIDDNTFETVWKKSGKTTFTNKVSVSKDGKTLTVNQSGPDASGKATNNTLVLDRQ